MGRFIKCVSHLVQSRLHLSVAVHALWVGCAGVGCVDHGLSCKEKGRTHFSLYDSKRKKRLCKGGVRRTELSCRSDPSPKRRKLGLTPPEVALTTACHAKEAYEQKNRPRVKGEPDLDHGLSCKRSVRTKVIHR